MAGPTDAAAGEGPDVQRLLELADRLGMEEEVGELRADIRQRQCVERIVRICQLAGLPMSTGGGPGIEIRPVTADDPTSRAFYAGAVTVAWLPSRELDQASDEAKPGDEPAELWSELHQATQLMLATILQRGRCATVLDNLLGDLVVRGVYDGEDLSALYRAPTP